MAQPLSRRRALRAAGTSLAVLTVGCVSQDSRPTPPECSSPIPLPSPTPRSDNVASPQSYPSLPDPLAQDTAAEFASGFEIAYLVNSWVAHIDSLNEFDLSLGKPATSTRGQGYLVRFTVKYDLDYGDRTPGTSARLTIADQRSYRANYYVSDRLVMRVESAPDSRADPVESGTIVRCAE